MCERLQAASTTKVTTCVDIVPAANCCQTLAGARGTSAWAGEWCWVSEERLKTAMIGSGTNFMYVANNIMYAASTVSRRAVVESNHEG